jgi:single-stranded DNA-binding protein
VHAALPGIKGDITVLNLVSLVGKIADPGPKLTYSENGQPECRWTLVVEEPSTQGKPFLTYVPCVSIGKAAEGIAEQLEVGQLICIRDGRLRIRRVKMSGGESVSRLEVFTFQVQVLSKASTPLMEDV